MVRKAKRTPRLVLASAGWAAYEKQASLGNIGQAGKYQYYNLYISRDRGVAHHQFHRLK